ncbi:MAG TPA: hypothetical protein VG871_02485, partial [Vicinamibacterales bacterium]|nr:hypothetical protein [Vicinamibacterales bacterium]
MAAPVFAATVSVAPGGDLQAALDAAQPGDVILLASGGTYVGNFRLPMKAGTADITIRTSSTDGSLPAPGVRISPDQAPLLA